MPRARPTRRSRFADVCFYVHEGNNAHGQRPRQFTLDARDVDVMARFWSTALGYEVDVAEDGAVHLRPTASDASDRRSGCNPGAGAKTTKNRCHLDLVAADAAREVERLLELGATRADVGQTGAEAFEVLADPEGNEFCVLHHWAGRFGA